MKRWLKITLIVLGIVLIGALAALLVLTYNGARDMITNPLADRKPITSTPADFDLPYEDVTMTTADGLNLVAWYIPSQNGAAIIVQHGLESDRQEMLPNAALLHRHGYGVLLSTVRAHDQSDGELIYFGQQEMQDLEAWYQYLLTRADVDPDKIGLLGESYGAFLIMKYAAENENIQAVVSHSGFYSIDASVEAYVANQGLPAFLAPLILFWGEQITGYNPDLADSSRWLADISPRPLFLLHGGQDDYVGPDCGFDLLNAAGEPKELWFEEEAGHTNFEDLYPAEYEARLAAFYDRWLLDQ